MEFLKKHYEKILLSVVLLGLVAATLWLPMTIKDAESESPVADSAPVRPKGVPNLDLSAERQSLQSVTNSQSVVLSGAHSLFNPVIWKRKPDGTLMKVLVEGPDALSILAIKPLNVTISYDSAAGTGYYLTVQYQSGKHIPREYVKVNEKAKSGLFTIHEVKGPAEDPTELVLELPGTQELVSVSKTNPCQRVDSYIVDLRYDPENKNFNKQKVHDSFIISGAAYNIVAITTNEVRVAAPNGKQTTVKWAGTPVSQ